MTSRPQCARDPLDVGQQVDEAGGSQDTPGQDRMATDEVDPEPLVGGAGHLDRPSGEYFAAVAADLLTPDRSQLGRRHSVRAEVSVHVRGRARCVDRRRRRR